MKLGSWEVITCVGNDGSWEMRDGRWKTNELKYVILKECHMREGHAPYPEMSLLLQPFGAQFPPYIVVGTVDNESKQPSLIGSAKY